MLSEHVKKPAEVMELIPVSKQGAVPERLPPAFSFNYDFAFCGKGSQTYQNTFFLGRREV